MYCESFAAVHRKAMSGFGSFEPARSSWRLTLSIRLNARRETQNDGLITRFAYRMPNPFSRSVM